MPDSPLTPSGQTFDEVWAVADRIPGWMTKGQAELLDEQARLIPLFDDLRAARAAEIAQMGEILDALDRMLGVTTTPRSHSTRNWARADADASDATFPGHEPPLRPLPDDEDEAELPEEEFTASVRELSVVLDEDPLPEDEPVLDLGAEDQPPRTGAARPEAADSEKDYR